jgi:hypothetical protein
MTRIVKKRLRPNRDGGSRRPKWALKSEVGQGSARVSRCEAAAHWLLQQAGEHARGAVGEDRSGCQALLAAATLAVDVAEGLRPAVGSDCEGHGFAPEPHHAAAVRDELGKAQAQGARTDFQIASSRGEVSALCDREVEPPQLPWIVGVVAEIAGQGELQGLLAAEVALQHVVKRGPPVADDGAQFERTAREPGKRAFGAREQEIGEAAMNALEARQDAPDTARMCGKTRGQRLASGGQSHRKVERHIERSAANREERGHLDPLEFIEQPKTFEDVMLGIARMARIGRLMQRGFDGERAHL